MQGNVNRHAVGVEDLMPLPAQERQSLWWRHTTDAHKKVSYPRWIIKTLTLWNFTAERSDSVELKVTVAGAAGLGLVKPDHFCVFGANLNLFVELQTQRK